MLAVKKENSYMITHLVGKKVNLDTVDGAENSVFHYAASTNMSIIEVRKKLLRY